MAKKLFKCPSCNRTFKMAAHLARHRSAAHGAKKKRRVKASGRKTAKRRRAARMGRPKGIASQLGLRTLSLEQLGEVVAAARAEARRRVKAVQQVL